MVVIEVVMLCWPLVVGVVGRPDWLVAGWLPRPAGVGTFEAQVRPLCTEVENSSSGRTGCHHRPLFDIVV